MATHDYVIANGTGQNVRQDLNDALAAIVSNNSSSSEPATRYAYQFWADTTANVLKIRNSANNAWITLRELDGTLLMEDGSASAPGLAFASDTDTGIFRDGTNSIALAAAGNERFSCSDSSVIVNQDGDDVDFRVESDGKTHMLYVDGGTNLVGIDESAPASLLSIGGNATTTAKPTVSVVPSSGDASISLRGGSPTIAFDITSGGDGTIIYDTSSDLLFKNGTLDSSSEVARIDSSGRLLHGTSASVTANSEARNVQIVTDVNNANQGLGIYAFTASNNAPRLDLGSSPNGSINTFTIASVDGGLCGRINFLGSDGDEFLPTARIEGRVDGTAGNGDMPGRLEFHTTADAASSPTERMRIDSSGRVAIGTSTINANSMLSVHRNTSDESQARFTNTTTGAGGNNGFIVGIDTTEAARLFNMENGPMRFGTNNTERMRIDSSGRLLVGVSSSQSVGFEHRLQIEGTDAASSSQSFIRNSNDSSGPQIDFAKTRGTSTGSNTAVLGNDTLGTIKFRAADGTDKTSTAAEIRADIDGTPGSNDTPGRLMFSTTADNASSPTERMRITDSGETFTFAATNGWNFRTGSTANTSNTIMQGAYGATSTLSGTTSIFIYSNGNVANTNGVYGSISDAKLKENIVDANSQWDDIKGLRVRNYNFIEGQTHTQLGVVAQEVETVSPGLVTESPDRDDEGNDLGTVTKSVNYSVLYMKAVKALQEAMDRIETLEAKVAALEAG